MSTYGDIEQLSWESKPQSDDVFLSKKFTKEALNLFLKVLIQIDPKNKDAYSIAPPGVIRVDLLKIMHLDESMTTHSTHNRESYVRGVSEEIFYQSPAVSMNEAVPVEFLQSLGFYSTETKAGAGAGAEHKVQP